MFQPHAANRSIAPSKRRVERQVHQSEQADHDRQRQHPQQRRQAVVLEHRHDGRSLLVVALGPTVPLGRTLAGRRRVTVTGAREWRHQHAEPGEPGTPAEVEILVVGDRDARRTARPAATPRARSAWRTSKRTAPRSRGRTGPGRSLRSAAACTDDRTGRPTCRPRGATVARPSRRPSGRRPRRARRRMPIAASTRRVTASGSRAVSSCSTRR